MEQQLMLFSEPKTEFTAIWEALEDLQLSQGKVRKKLFAQVGDLQKEVIDLRAENDRLKFHVEVKPTIRWTA